jgi:hypothetical protein
MVNWLELEEKARKSKMKTNRKHKESWQGVLEKLNKNGNYVWTPIIANNKIIGVRKIPPL